VREKSLLKTATRGVVLLFNAVNKSQKARKEADAAGKKANISKSSFIAQLKGELAALTNQLLDRAADTRCNEAEDVLSDRFRTTKEIVKEVSSGLDPVGVSDVAILRVFAQSAATEGTGHAAGAVVDEGVAGQRGGAVVEGFGRIKAGDSHVSGDV
jgi:hypothetical protein